VPIKNGQSRKTGNIGYTRHRTKIKQQQQQQQQQQQKHNTEN
jgi:hypothetical protein